MYQVSLHLAEDIASGRGALEQEPSGCPLEVRQPCFVLRSSVLCSFVLCSFVLCSFVLCSFVLCSFVLCSSVLCSQ